MRCDVSQLELAFKEQLEAEERARVAEKERVEREKLEARKQREVQRITDVSIFLCFRGKNWPSEKLYFYFYFSKVLIIKNNYYYCFFFMQERRKEGDRWKANNVGETVNGADDDDFDPNMRYVCVCLLLLIAFFSGT